MTDMTDTPCRSTLVYLVEDDELVRRACEQAMKLADIPVRGFSSAEHALAALDDEPPGVIVSDVRMPGISGLELLERMQARDRDIPVILITGHGDVSMAVQAMRAHAYDFIEKPFNSARLIDVVRRALEKRALIEENQRLREQLGSLRDTPLIGHSESIQRIVRTIDSLAPTDVDILILGETGTGKEVVAQALHARSGRSGPFVALNCGALPEPVFESEMFGHETGAFTGAEKRRIGKIEYADKGTLFLDEIESMPLALQVKLLRVLQERTLERLGSNASIPVSCRVVAATKTDLKQLVAQGRFRADLYYRLNVVTLELPPLRQRLNDIAPLMTYFISQASRRFNREAPSWGEIDLLRWQQHDWPGNVRELKATAERLCLGLTDGLEATPSATISLSTRLDQYERSLIRDALRTSQGNVAEAAELLRVPKKTLYDKLTRHQLDPESFRTNSGN
ncbi:sigma-54-dependent transcriptional regulator [Propionivibrio dicarboxylicus]|uniref:Two-component system, NtrC family, C4-dicarboxylate transport response regulator DctD n=1 Tax=Propionivibrio dicarboxylicus TaxID=83767 RepID=A0A1G8LHY1_9RHOO|nr:sigma-54 dependent transcriptional regulator [Propionivibrio dicarboxylicus]SDI55047.1 two-component system, NtrC family, C4-dicarboxylate transport response regulator DctD [Propionivibrio dicarboxylicus]